VTGQVIASLERGLNHDEVTAAFVSALSTALALPVTAVFTRTTPAPRPPAVPGASADQPGAEDLRQVGALLALTGALVPGVTLAAVLGWPVPRVQAALTALDAALPAVGQRLHRLGGDVKVVSDGAAVPATTVTALARRAFARRGMTLSQARLLRRAWLGELTGAEHGNADRVALAELVNADLVSYPAGTGRGTRPALTDDVALSLGTVRAQAARPLPGCGITDD
jgi:hypothetical protein